MAKKADENCVSNCKQIAAEYVSVLPIFLENYISTFQKLNCESSYLCSCLRVNNSQLDYVPKSFFLRPMCFLTYEKFICNIGRSM